MRFLTITFSLFLFASTVLTTSWVGYTQTKRPSGGFRGNFNIRDDPNRGHVTVENKKIKVVFHYLTVPEEYNNQGGGNLYELYDKITDPQAQRNLIAVHQGGNEDFKALGVGAGGVGNTGMYVLAELPTFTDPSAFISDNVPDARYLSHSLTKNEQGWPKITFRFVVGDRLRKIDWYEIEKVWEIEPSGKIHLKHNWKLLRSGWLSEVATRSQWSYDRGWTTLSKWGHDWVTPDCDQGTQSNGYKCLLNDWVNVPIGEIKDAAGNCWNHLNMFHVQKYVLKGSQTAPRIIVSTDNSGLGFEGSGLWKINRIISDETATDSILEQCTYDRRAVGDGDASHGVGFFSWFGGAVATPDRYHYADLEAKPELRSWQDSYTIQLIPPPFYFFRHFITPILRLNPTPKPTRGTR